MVEGVAIDSKDGHDILRHSTAHVMALAVQQLFPEAKLGIGPPVQDGFYYDFDVETPFVPEDLAKIETAMSTLETRLKGDDKKALEIAVADLERESMELGRIVYEQAAKTAQESNQAEPKAGATAGKDDVIDAEFKVKE